MEFSSIFVWYIVIFLLGVIGLPFSRILFKDWKDNGYGFAKIIGLVITALTIWLLASIKLVPFNELSVITVTIFWFCFSLILLKKQKTKINKLMIVEEIMFFLIFIFWTFLRSVNPRIEGTEKLMNIGIINSILRSEYFPPKDIWLSGENINYYYLGHFLQAFLAKLSGIPSFISYNLGIGTIFALSFGALTSLFLQIFAITKRGILFLSATAASLFILLSGNLHYFINLLTSLIKGKTLSYFYASATRLIPFTINEFPLYSVVLGDLHGHYLNLPIFILAIAFIYRSFLIPINSNLRLQFSLMISPFLALMYAVNSWDLITVIFIFILTEFIQLFYIKIKLKKKIIIFMKLNLARILPGIILLLPFILSFNPPVGGIGFVPLNIKSSPIEFLLIWGGFLLIIFIFIASIIKDYIKINENKKTIVFAGILAVAGMLIILGVEFIFLKDIFYYSNNNYFRANTVFKFYYATWVIWGIACSIFIYLVLTKYTQITKSNLLITKIIIFIIVFASLIYFPKSIFDNFLGGRTPSPTLNGINYVKQNYPGDYYAIKFINENIPGTPVIMEAVGLAYTYFARISSYTGLPTIIGWPTHEWQWRDNSEIPFARKQDVERAYNAPTVEELMNVITKYNVEYIFVGQKEEETYKNISLELFNSNFVEIFNFMGTKIYKVPDFVKDKYQL